jgi:hypothetical protein
LKTLTYDQALNKAAALCSQSERCPSDIFEKVVSWGISESDAARLVGYLTREGYLDEAAHLLAQLSAIEGLTVLDSHTNFMLCRIEKTDARQLKQWLLENYNILIRDASNFHGLDTHYFRVAAQSPAEDEALSEAIKEYLSGKSRHFKKYW